jgi:hypothetical protein
VKQSFVSGVAKRELRDQRRKDSVAALLASRSALCDQRSRQLEGRGLALTIGTAILANGTNTFTACPDDATP